MLTYSGLVAAVLLASSGTVDAYWRQTCSIVQTGRIDPIISPGQVSSHVHKISGGSNINLSSDYDDMRNSSCTSCEITADKSGYWTPQMYYEHADGSFEEVPNGQTVVYYLGRGDNRANIVPFPPGFRMVSGNPLARSYDASTLTWNGGRPISDRVSFNCLDTTGHPETPGFNMTNCPYGLRAQIQFPSCWDGVNNYLPNSGHVAYMSQIDNGVCPPAFPVQLVHLFYEVLYGVDEIDQSDGGRFVFAYGDPTGYGFHGDFLMGWDFDVLNQSLAQCANTDNGGVISACAPLASLDTSTYGYNCPQYAPNSLPLVNETVTGKIGNKLPGCVNIVNGPTWATVADVSCPANATVPSVNVFASQTPTVTASLSPGESVGLNGWQYVDCYTDNANSVRVLAGSSTTSTTMTITSCQTQCSNQGFRFAGLEDGNQCWCSSIIASGNSGNQTNCNMGCAGNMTQICGSPSLISIFNNTLSTATIAAPGAGYTSAAAGIYVGCATDNVSGRALNGASTTSSSMTLESCRAYCDAQGYILSGAEYSGECYCGNALANGGAILASNASCNMLCYGNNAETCGAGNRLSVFSSNTITALPNLTVVNGYTSQGCWIDSSTRALSGSSYADGSNMTIENCVGYCSGHGYSYAGIEYASQCYCGNSLLSGSLAQASDCSMQCSGNEREMCGAGWRLTLYHNATSASGLSSSSVIATSTSTSTPTTTTLSKTSTTSISALTSTSSSLPSSSTSSNLSSWNTSSTSSILSTSSTSSILSTSSTSSILSTSSTSSILSTSSASSASSGLSSLSNSTTSSASTTTTSVGSTNARVAIAANAVDATTTSSRSTTSNSKSTASSISTSSSTSTSAIASTSSSSSLSSSSTTSLSTTGASTTSSALSRGNSTSITTALSSTSTLHSTSSSFSGNSTVTLSTSKYSNSTTSGVSTTSLSSSTSLTSTKSLGTTSTSSSMSGSATTTKSPRMRRGEGL